MYVIEIEYFDVIYVFSFQASKRMNEMLGKMFVPPKPETENGEAEAEKPPTEGTVYILGQ